MKPISIKIRGAIGIYEGIGLDEITIDFAQFKPGLIALVGRNGSGKTTTMDCLHQYLSFGSRDGFAKNFRLRDSVIDYEFDGGDGHIYRSIKLIDADSTKVEAYLSDITDRETFNDGKVSTYKAIVEEKFGSEELFFNSVFAAQKRPGIAKAKPAKRKELFSELLGIMRYAQYESYAKERSDAEENELEKLKGKRESISNAEDRHQTELLKLQDEDCRKLEVLDSIDAIRSEVKEYDDLILGLEKKLTQAQSNQVALDQLEIEHRELKYKMTTLENRHRFIMDDMNIKISDLEREESEQSAMALRLDSLQQEFEQIPAIESMLAEYKQMAEYCNEISLLIGHKRSKLAEAMAEYEKSKSSIKEEYELKIEKVREQKEEESAKYHSALLEYQKAVSENEANFQRALAEYHLKIGSHKNRISSIEKERDLNSNSFQNQRKGFERNIASLQATSLLTEEVPCKDIQGLPEQCKLLKNANDAKHSLPEMRDKLKAFEEQYNQLEDKLLSDLLAEESALKHLEKDVPLKESLILNYPNAMGTKYDEAIGYLEIERNDKINGLPLPFDPEIEKLIATLSAIGYDSSDHLKVENKLKALHAKNLPVKIEKAKTCKLRAEVLTVDIKGLEKQKQDLQNEHHSEEAEISLEIQKKEQRIKELFENSNIATLNNTLIAKQTERDEKQQEFEAYDLELRAIDAKIAVIQSEIETLNKQIIELANLSNEIQEISSRLEAWRILQRACSKDGIPALEIDVAGIDVSDIANDLLKSSFGSKYQIQFETTKLSKDKKKTIEVFDIKILTPTGECLIEDLSGGQQVWIETALSQACAIYLSRKSGRKYLTTYNDEVDGALDPENKQHFLDMLNRSFELGDREFSFVITHTDALVEQIPQKIIFDDKAHTIEIIS